MLMTNDINWGLGSGLQIRLASCYTLCSYILCSRSKWGMSEDNRPWGENDLHSLAGCRAFRPQNCITRPQLQNTQEELQRLSGAYQHSSRHQNSLNSLQILKKSQATRPIHRLWRPSLNSTQPLAHFETTGFASVWPCSTDVAFWLVSVVDHRRDPLLCYAADKSPPPLYWINRSNGGYSSTFRTFDG